MDNQIIYPLISALQHLFSAEIFTLLYLAFAGMLLLLAHRFLGLMGLYIFILIALLCANIQVLGLTEFNSIAWLKEPIALGMVTATITFLASDVITEHYGAKKARWGIVISLMAELLFMLLMLGGMGYNHTNTPVESAIQLLFIPGPRLILASLIAYGSSQLVDIQLFRLIKKWCQQRYLWVRTLGSMTISGFVDTFIFSALAWIILNPEPVTWEVLFLSYILIPYIMRVFVQILVVPVIYLSYFTKPKREPLLAIMESFA